MKAAPKYKPPKKSKIDKLHEDLDLFIDGPYLVAQQRKVLIVTEEAYALFFKHASEGSRYKGFRVSTVAREARN